MLYNKQTAPLDTQLGDLDTRNNIEDRNYSGWIVEDDLEWSTREFEGKYERLVTMVEIRAIAAAEKKGKEIARKREEKERKKAEGRCCVIL